MEVGWVRVLLHPGMGLDRKIRLVLEEWVDGRHLGYIDPVAGRRPSRDSLAELEENMAC